MYHIEKMVFPLIMVLLLAGCNSSGIPTESTDTEDFGIAQTSSEQTTLAITKRSVEENAATNWYIRLVAEDISKNLLSSDAQLGVLEEDNTVTKHTLSAFPPMGGNYLDIVFRDPVGVEPGDYKSNFHAYADNTEQRWQFTVRTDNVNDQIALSWRGLYVLTPYIDDEGRQRYREVRSMTNPLIRNMQLRDVQTGAVFGVLSGSEPKVYYFNMNGQSERTFEWIVIPNSVVPPEVSKQ